MDRTLERAAEYSTSGLGSQWQLKYQWDGATSPVYFNILEGVQQLGTSSQSVLLAKHNRVRNVQLEVVCEPFALGTAETLESWLDNPGFELGASADADWTDSNLTAAAESSDVREGSKAGKVTANASGTQPQRSQAVSSLTDTKTYIFGIDVKGAAANDQAWRLRVVSGGNSAISTVPNDGAWAERTVVITADGTSATVYVETTGNVTDTDDVVLMDKAYFMERASAPVAWASGRSVHNELAGGSQVETDYLDLEDIPGDIPALLQVRAAENEAHTDFWLGARHGSRARDSQLFHQGEEFSATGWGTAADGSASDDAVGWWNNSGTGISTNPASPTVVTKSVATLAQGQYRMLARLRKRQVAGATNIDMYAALGYSYGGNTQDPQVAADYVALDLGDNYQLYDLGALTLPPVKAPSGLSDGTLTLRLAFYAGSALGGGNDSDFYCDWLMFFPADFGFVYVSKPSQQDVVWVNSRSTPQGSWLLDTSDVVQAFPTGQWGSAPEAHPQGTRLYFASDDGNADVDDGWKVRVTYLLRYLHVA